MKVYEKNYKSEADRVAETLEQLLPKIFRREVDLVWDNTDLGRDEEEEH